MQNLSESDLKAIESVVGAQIRAQFEQGCICGLKKGAVEEMSHFWGMMEDEGGGKASVSVERFRTVLKAQKRIEQWSSKAALTIVAVTAGAACYGMWDICRGIWNAVKSRIPV